MTAWLKRNKFWVLAAATFVVHSVITYWGVIHYHYVVAPGDDTLSHLSMISALQQQPVLWPTSGYPPGFHYLIWGLSRLIGHSPAGTMAVVWPSFVILSGVAIFFLAKKTFGLPVAVLAYILFALVSPQPLQTAYDGGFPNIIASGILLPLSMICWIDLWQHFRLRILAAFLLLGAAIVFTHHLSTIIWLGLIASSGLALAIVKTFQATGHRRWRILAGYGAALLLFAVLYEKTPLFGAAKQLASFSVQGAESPRWDAFTYGQSLTGLVFQLSFLGAALAIYQACRRKLQISHLGPIVVIAWFLLYFIGSRLSFVVEPGRLARDLAMPAAILAAYAIVLIYRYLSEATAVQTLFTIAVVLLVFPAVVAKAEGQMSYSKMIRFSRADQEVLQYIDTHGPYPYLVWVRNGFWQFEAVPELQSGKVRLVDPSALDEVYQGRSCAIAGYYQPGVWQEYLQDHTVVDTYRNDPRLTNLKLAEDPTKVWYLFCRKPKPVLVKAAHRK